MNKSLYILKRLALALPVILFGLTVSFLILYRGPLDPANAILGRDAAPSDVRRLRIALGYLNPDGSPVPLWEQYVGVMSDLLTFDFGNSWAVQRNVAVGQIILGRMPATLWLGFWSVMVALVVGIPVGFFAGLRANTLSDYVASGGGIIWRAMPNFWLAVILAGSLTAGGLMSWYRHWPCGPNQNPCVWRTDVVSTPDEVSNMFSVIELFNGIPVLEMLFIPVPNAFNMLIAFKWILPAALVLGSASMGNEIRIGRTAVLESINSKYVETAKAKGLSPRRIIVKHVGRNASIPLLPVIMGEFYLLIGGSVLVEKVFSINGLGNLFFRAIVVPDIPVVMALIFIFVIINQVFNITQDLLYTLIDPRVTLEDTG
jgi:peptide/nickel transport system permease protein